MKTKDISVEKQTDSQLKSSGYEYTNGQNDYRINFSSDIQKGVLTEFDNCGYSIIPQTDYISSVGKESTSIYLNDKFETFEYSGAFGAQTVLKFYPQLNGLKDEIVLNQNVNKNNFSFVLKTDNCKAVLNDDGTVSLISNEDESNVVQTFTKPFAYDSEYVEGDMDEHYIDCTYTLEQIDDYTYIMSVTVDKSWLDSEATIYPVTIDPTTSNLSNYKDAGIYSSATSRVIPYGNEATCCFGRTSNSEFGYGRVLNHFSWPEDIKKGAKINSAYIWERETTGRTSTTYVAPCLVDGHWAESSVTWETRPGYLSSTTMASKNINSKSTDKSGDPYWYKFDITSAVQLWADKTYGNYGLLFRSSEEDDENYNWRAFASKQHSTSSYRPYTVINYTNDTVAPTISSVTGNPTAWTNGNVTLTVNGAADNSGGIGLHSTPYSFSTTKGSYAWQSGNTKTFSSNCTVYIYVRDAMGNIRLASTQTINKIDKTAPSVPNVTGNATEWTNGSVTLTADSADSQSGVAAYSFSTVKDSYSWQTGKTKTVAENTTLYVYSKDNAGNISAPKEIIIDKITNNPDYLLDLSFYEENHKIGIINPRNNNDPIQYKIGENGNWIDYIIPFALPIGEEVTVYAKFKDTSKTISQLFTSKSDEYIGGFTESATDLVISFAGVSFNVARYYNSYNNKWFFSTNTKIENLDNNIIQLILPDSRTVVFTQKENSSYVNKEFDYSLMVLYNESNIIGYKVNIDNIIYGYSEEGLLISIADNNENSIHFEYINGNLSKIYYGIDEVREYNIEFSNGLINAITTPLGEKIIYLYDSNNNLTDVYYDKDTLQIIREDNIILGHYEYENQRMSECNTDEIIYDNNKLAKVICADGSSVDYNFFIVNDSEVYGDESQNVSVYKIVSTTSSGKISTSYYNNALNLIKYNDTDGVYELCAYDVYQNLVSEIDNSTKATYNYDGITLNSSLISGTETMYNEFGNKIKEKERDKETTYSYLNNDGKTLEKIETITAEKSGSNLNSKVTYSFVNKYQNGKLQSSTETITDFITDCSGTSKIQYNNDNTISSIVAESITEDESTEKETTSFLYDEFGNIQRRQSVCEDSEETKLSVSNYEYDALNRNIEVTDNAGEVEQKYIYDSVDNTIYQNINSNVSRTIYDEYSRTIRRITNEDYDESCDGLSNDTKEDSYSDISAGYTYTYDENGNIQSETDREGLTTTYSYYENSSILKTESFDSYVFSYDKLGNVIRITVGGQLYAEFRYNDYNNPTKVSYGNGQSIRYIYNGKGNLLEQYHNDDADPYIIYTYESTGSLSDSEIEIDFDWSDELEVDSNLEIKTAEEQVLESKINYDTQQKTVYSNGIATVYSLESNNRLFSYNIREDNEKSDYEYTYVDNSTISTHLDDDELFDVISIKDSNGVSNSIKLLSGTIEVENDLNYDYNIVYNGDTAVSTTDYRYDDKGNIIEESFKTNDKEFVYTYTYDDEGKITSFSPGENEIVTYEYYEDTDAIGCEVIDTNSNDVKFIYIYDERGNVIEKDERDCYGLYTTTYNYDSEIWNDELSSYTEGKDLNIPFLYDENGNPIDTDGVTLEWTSGRLLDCVCYYSEDGTKHELMSFTYDEKGFRTSKTYHGDTTYFTNIDGMITSQYQLSDDGSVINEVIFIYDRNNQLIGFIYDNNVYYYLKNHMNDVIAVLDSDGNVLVEYAYDAWGNMYHVSMPTDESSEIYWINPICYRSYYYDWEMFSYYLQSRYYAPNLHRFINADIPEFIRQGKNDYAGTNLFAYCNNNPVNKYDPNGTWGADVHNGYNPKPNNENKNKEEDNSHCNLFEYIVSGFGIVREYYGTYYWAKACGYNDIYAQMLGYYCNFVDKKYSSLTNWKDNDKWHFYTVDGKDVRMRISREEQSLAKNYLQVATTAYYKWMNFVNIYGSNNSFTLMQYNLYQNNLLLGLTHLGYSLHPVQDIYAHTRGVCFQFESGRWFHLLGNVDDPELHKYAVLGPTASKTMEILLIFYNDYYILRN